METTLVVYDPGAVRDRTWRHDEDDAEIYAEAERGNLLVYRGGDGEVHVRIFVDEPVEPETERRGSGLSTGVLHVPSGRLRIDGAIALTRGRTEGGPEHAIAPGSYDVRAFEIQWGDEDDKAATRAAEEASPRGAATLEWLGPLTGCLVAFTVFGGGIAACALNARQLVDGTLRFGPWWAALVVAVVVAWRVTGAGKAQRAFYATRDSYPRVAVSLRRLPDGEDSALRRGCVL